MALHPAVGGESRDVWQAVHRLRANEALTSELSTSLNDWGDLATARLTIADPALGIALYELGELRWIAGDIAGAREALDHCIRQTNQRSQCSALRSQIDLEVDAVRSIPQHWTFDDVDHGLYHPRAYWERGSLKIAQTPEGGTLRWTKRLDPTARPDHLVAGFDRPSPSPRRLRLDITSEVRDARLEVRLEDDLGREMRQPTVPFVLPAGERRAITVDLSTPSRGQELAHLYRLYLVDLTSQGGERGSNTLVLHELILE